MNLILTHLGYTCLNVDGLDYFGFGEIYHNLIFLPITINISETYAVFIR